MIAHLADPWFEAAFVRTNADGGYHNVDTIDDADGVEFWCPCGYGKPEFPLDGARPHLVLIHFANPRGCPPAPDAAVSRGRDGLPTRWSMSGTSIADLTLSPSVDVGTPSCWHGFIRGGVVT